MLYTEIFFAYLVWALTPKASSAECTKMSGPLGGSVALRVQGRWFISCPRGLCGEASATRAARAIAVATDAAALTFRSYGHGDWPGRVIWGGPERWPVCPIR